MHILSVSLPKAGVTIPQGCLCEPAEGRRDNPWWNCFYYITVYNGTTL